MSVGVGAHPRRPGEWRYPDRGTVGGRVEPVKRWIVIAVSFVLACVGCARQAPVTPSVSPSVSPSTEAVVIGTTTDPTIKVLAELYAQALTAKGRAARIVEVDDDTNVLVTKLMAGDVDLAPAFAWTAGQVLEVDSGDPSTLVSDLATALDGQVTVLQASGVDHGWRYLAEAPGRSLQELAATDLVVGPAAWAKAPDGPAGLARVYAKKPTVETVDDPAARAEKVRAGAVGVFDGTDPAAAGLQPVDDPLAMVAIDPQVALLNTDLAGDDVVLDVVQQLHGMLGNDDVMAIRSKAATGDLTRAVSEWLSANPLT